MSQLAYETDDVPKIKDVVRDWGVQVVEGGVISEEVATILPQASTQIVVGIREGVVIIAFAGTDPLVLADWITDFDIGTIGTGIANGFNVAARAGWPKLQSLIQNASTEASILLTGHSLGGALAVLTAAEFHRLIPGRVASVYTFGMPRVGDVSFAVAYHQMLGPRTFRLVHGEDIVPTVAPSFLGFRHVGQYIHCSRRGKFPQSTPISTVVSDEPEFVRGASKELRQVWHRPISRALAASERWKLAIALTLGLGPRRTRFDLGGAAIELLPPRLRDHMPDRYIEAIQY